MQSQPFNTIPFPHSESAIPAPLGPQDKPPLTLVCGSTYSFTHNFRVRPFASCDPSYLSTFAQTTPLCPLLH